MKQAYIDPSQIQQAVRVAVRKMIATQVDTILADAQIKLGKLISEESLKAAIAIAVEVERQFDRPELIIKISGVDVASSEENPK